jgi:hypothetical protein
LGQFYDSNRDYQSNYWASLEILGQPCDYFSFDPGGRGSLEKAKNSAAGRLLESIAHHIDSFDARSATSRPSSCRQTIPRTLRFCAYRRSALIARSPAQQLEPAPRRCRQRRHRRLLQRCWQWREFSFARCAGRRGPGAGAGAQCPADKCCAPVHKIYAGEHRRGLDHHSNTQGTFPPS